MYILFKLWESSNLDLHEEFIFFIFIFNKWVGLGLLKQSQLGLVMNSDPFINWIGFAVGIIVVWVKPNLSGCFP